MLVFGGLDDINAGIW